MSSDYESVLCVKNEVFVFKIPPRSSNRGYRAADWKLEEPDWSGRMRIVAIGKNLYIKLEDKTSGELFAQCPVEEYPGIAVESVTDSSRYFVIRIKDDSGRSAFIGIGFTDRGDSFDLNVALQDHFKWLKNEEDAKKATAEFNTGPKLDLGFKEGQTIKINIQTKKDPNQPSKARPKGQGAAGLGILPPPPGGMKLPPPPGGISQPQQQQKPVTAAQFFQPQTISQSQNSNSSSNQSNIDLLLDFDSLSGSSGSLSKQPSLPPQQTTQAADPWGDFASANSKSAENSSWVQF